MQINKLKPGQVVQFDWADSKALMGWTYNPNAKRSPGYIRTIGFVVQVNEECLTVTTSRDKSGATIDDFSVPIGCITRLQVLPEDYHYEGPQENEDASQ